MMRQRFGTGRNEPTWSIGAGGTPFGFWIVNSAGASYGCPGRRRGICDVFGSYRSAGTTPSIINRSGATCAASCACKVAIVDNAAIPVARAPVRMRSRRDDARMSLALADLSIVRVGERRLWTLHIQDSRAARVQRVGTSRARCLIEAGIQHCGAVGKREERNQVALV